MDDLIKYRLDSAKEKLVSAKLLLDAGQYKDSVGRSYIQNIYSKHFRFEIVVIMMTFILCHRKML